MGLQGEDQQEPFVCGMGTEGHLHTLSGWGRGEQTPLLTGSAQAALGWETSFHFVPHPVMTKTGHDPFWMVNWLWLFAPSAPLS